MLNDHNDGSGFITDGHGFRSLFTESMNLWRSFLDVEITGLLTPEKRGSKCERSLLPACLVPIEVVDPGVSVGALPLAGSPLPLVPLENQNQ